MRAFLLWLILSLLCWTGLERWLDSSFRTNPRLVVVALDTSFAMEPVWNAIPPLLGNLDGAPYESYELHGPRGKLDGPAERVAIGTLRPYGPRSFDRLAKIGVEAHRRILITNATADELPAPTGWTVLSP
ncbi:MAG: hypothetical protein AAF501_10865 [Pseudomonadota bacterium]